MQPLGAIALYASDLASTTRPPHRPNRPARRANQGARILGFFRQLGSAFIEAIEGAPVHLPPVARSYPY
jgi:hypothetical protein